MIKEEFYGNRAIAEILFNQKSKTVATFKDHMIYDETFEFL